MEKTFQTKIVWLERNNDKINANNDKINFRKN